MLVEFSDRRLGYGDRLQWHAAIGSCAFNGRNIGWICAKTKQHEATSKKVQRRMSIAKPGVRRSRTRARTRNVVCRIVWMGQGAVGDADRRVLVLVAKLKSRG